MPELAEGAPRLHKVETVMERLSLGRNKVFDAIGSGELRSIKVGRRRLVSEAALVDYICRLEAGTVDEQRTDDLRDDDPRTDDPRGVVSRT